MFFFVNRYLLPQNSSIEHTELARLRLFKRHQSPAQLVLRDFLPNLDQTLQRFNLDRSQVTTLYDFFAGTQDYVGVPLKIDDLALPVDYQIGTGNNFRQVTLGGRLVAEIYFIGGTVAQVGRIDYFDDSGNKTLSQIYDWRGFKCLDRSYGKQGELFYEQYYRPNGQRYLERYYVQSTKNTAINSLNILKDYQGRDYFFDDLDDLFTFFLDELNRSHGENNQFIADRPQETINPVLRMQTKAHKYLWMAMPEGGDRPDQAHGPLATLLQAALVSNVKAWDGILAASQEQVTNLRARVGNQVPVYQVSPVVIKSVAVTEPKTPADFEMIYAGRIAPDKQIDQLLQIFAQIHQQVSKTHLTIYGYCSDQLRRGLDQLIEELKLQGAVTWAGYQVDLSKAYQEADLYLDASRIDAFPLAMVEALAHSVPVVSYDFQYGPKELVQSGVNGELVPVNQVSQFVQKVVQLLKNPAKLNQYRQQAGAQLANYQDEMVWQQWERVK
ncbi:accessory Sec system glycosyltransferase Asp1, partial [Limosilactobacillus gastricus]|uniref:accessory Sec system glycosyltransferase Asp1 n=1 Tax=Limosilactobacillus gastricus TaxID=227942 RepID=UPI0026EC4B4E